MKIVKIVAIVLLAWVGVVVAFESLIGYFQPESGSTLILTSFEPDESAHDRVLARLESDGKLYVAANHWPRAWYERVLENPDVLVTVDGEKKAFRAYPVPPSSPEHERVEADHSLGLVFRILTGFPPRYFLRLEPR